MSKKRPVSSFFDFRSMLSDLWKCHGMSKSANKWAKVADVDELSVTDKYEKVCVSEGAIAIVIGGPKLRHVGASWGGAPD